MVFDGNDTADAATRPPVAFQFGIARLRDGDKIVEYSIGHVFVKNSLISESLEVQLEAFQFHAKLVRDVAKHQGTKVGLARFWANRGKLWTTNLDLIVSIRKTIVKNFQFIAKIEAHLGTDQKLTKLKIASECEV